MADRYPAAASERFVAAMHRPAVLLGRALHDLEVYRAEPPPLDQPVILAANHLSHIDPVLVTIVAGRNVRYLAVDELFGRSRLFDTVTGFFGTIPLPRGGVPLRALRIALEHLEAGGALGVFPEGRRVAYWGEEWPRRGAAWLALRTGAPLYPVAIAGSESTMSPLQPRFRRTPIGVWSGPPLHPDGYLDRIDPLGAMMADWKAWMDVRLGPWARARMAEGGPAT